MKILVTGAAGKIGAYVVRELLNAGHEVRALDRTGLPTDLRGRAEVVYADVADRMAMLRAAQDCDAIAHLAAIPNPVNGNDVELFEPNVLGTQYVLAAAEANGIGRVVLASSASIYGVPFAKKPLSYQYLPVDENHPIEPQDLYALSKQCNELTAAAYTRRGDMATTCLRMTFVIDFEGAALRWGRRHIERSHEWPSSDLWHYVDVRDVGRAFRLALENISEGHHIAGIMARDLLTPHDRRDLIKRHYPQLEKWLDFDFDFDHYGFFDSRRAEQLFGFVAERFWRDVPALRDNEEGK